MKKFPKYVKTADGYIGTFQYLDFGEFPVYRFQGGSRIADAWELEHGSDNRADLEPKKFKVKLVRDKNTGDYYSEDRKYWLEKCDMGYNLYEMSGDGAYDFCMSVDTLKEFRLIMQNQHRHEQSVNTVKSVIERFSRRQAERNFPCPRCGRMDMDDKPCRNALSRRVFVYICDFCGTEEAIEDAIGERKSIDDWAITKHPERFGMEANS